MQYEKWILDRNKSQLGGDDMAKRVLLIMKRKMLSDALVDQAAGDSRFELVAVQNYSTAALTAESCSPEIILVEIPESGCWKTAEKCLALCDAIHRQLPECKKVILCNADDTISYKASIRAKQENRIDDFVFYDSSVRYLFSKLEALTKKE